MSNKPSPCKRRSNTVVWTLPPCCLAQAEEAAQGSASLAVRLRSRSECMDENARALPWLSAAILRFTGNEIAQIPTASPHDAPPISTRRCCQSEKRQQHRGELVMFSLYCLFLIFGVVHRIPPEFITPLSLPPAFKTIILQPPGSSYQRQPDGQAAWLGAPPDLLIERDGRHCCASLQFASPLLQLASLTPRVIATSLINRPLKSLAASVCVFAVSLEDQRLDLKTLPLSVFI